MFGKDYEKAGLPSLTRIFTSLQLSRITFIWIFSTAAACMMIPLFGMVESHAIHGGLFAITLCLIWKSLGLLKAKGRNFTLGLPLKTINAYALVVMVLLTLDNLFH
jgi:protoheme IX farnesyltransferase